MQINTERRSLVNKAVFQVIIAASLMIGVYHLFIGTGLQLSATDVAKSFLFQILGIILPGTAIYIFFYQQRHDLLSSVCVIYILGYALNILFYFLLVPLGLKNCIPAFTCFAAIMSLLSIGRNGASMGLMRMSIKDLGVAIVFVIYLVIATLSYSCANTPSPNGGSTWLHQDLLYWVENSIALTKGFPAVNLRVSVGKIMYYHYFSSVQIAFQSLATGIDCFALSTAYYSIGKAFIFYGAMYLFISNLTDNRYLRLFGLSILCFTTGFEGISHITYASHMLTNPFGFDIASAYGMFFLHCFYIQYKNTSFDWKKFALSMMAFFVCVGSKAPVGLIVMVAAGIVCIGWLFRKEYKLAFTYGISLLVVFFCVMILFVGLKNGSGESKVGTFSPFHNLFGGTPGLLDIGRYLGGHWPSLLKAPLMLLIYLFSANPLVFGMFIPALYSVWKEKRMRTMQMTGLLTAGLFGILLGLVNCQDGNSQMYFTMAAMVPCLAVDLKWLELRMGNWSGEKRVLAGITVLYLLCCQLHCMFYEAKIDSLEGNGVRNLIRSGYSRLFNVEKEPLLFREDSIQGEDLAALTWIRENTPEESIVLSDRSVLTGMPEFMYYGAFSERQQYLEGDIYFRQTFQEERDEMRRIISGVFNNEKEALLNAIEDGVDYIVQTRWVTAQFEPDPDYLELVFASDSIHVYEVVCNGLNESA